MAAREISLLCIENNFVADRTVRDELVSLLQSKNFRTLIYYEEFPPAQCKHTMKYTGTIRLDLFGSYLSEASVLVYEDGDVIGRANYASSGGDSLGPDPLRFGSVRGKLAPMLDELFAQTH